MKRARDFLAALGIALLVSCSYAPEQATSIEDYCGAVRTEASRYEQLRELGDTEDDVRVYILWNFKRIYPAREVTKMLDVLHAVYGGVAPSEVERTCVEQRRAGTWFI